MGRRSYLRLRGLDILGRISAISWQEKCDFPFAFLHMPILKVDPFPQKHNRHSYYIGRIKEKNISLSMRIRIHILRMSMGYII